MPELTPSKVIRIRNIFIEKNWSLGGEEVLPSNIFNTYCSSISLLDPEEQDLVIDLTEEFLYCIQQELIKRIYLALNSIDYGQLGHIKNIFLVQMKVPADYPHEKSTEGVSYIVLYTLKHLFDFFTSRKVISITQQDYIKEYHRDRTDSLIMFLDDFAGSGGTIVDVVSYYNNNIKIDSDVVISVVGIAQQAAIDRLAEEGYTVYAGEVRKKGIADSDKFLDKDKAYEVLDQIEYKIRANKHEKRGYMSSEALVGTLRTPNNTFPVFWKESRLRDGTPWLPPFPRRRR